MGVYVCVCVSSERERESEREVTTKVIMKVVDEILR